jgi:predicted  nucleic acid-binding Zn-ribbon protein
MDPDKRPAKIYHLRELKTKVDAQCEELSLTIEEMRKEMLAMKRELESLRTASKNHLNVLKTHENALSNHEIVLREPPAQSNELVLGQIKASEARIYNQVTKEIAEKYLPRMNEMAKYIHFHTEDPMAVVNEYRYNLNRKQVSAIANDEFDKSKPRLFFK